MYVKDYVKDVQAIVEDKHPAVSCQCQNLILG